MINQCLTGKTSGYDRPRYPVLQILWGIITRTIVDYAELLWEEFVQAIQAFLTDEANLGSPTKKGRKDKPRVIPYCRFTKLIIYHLGRIHNIHQRSTSPFHLAEEDLRLAEKEGKKKLTTAKQPKEGKKKLTTAKQPKPNPAKEKSSKPTHAPKPKVTKEKSTKPSPAMKTTKDEGEDQDVERAIQMSLKSFQAQGQAHVGGVVIREPVAEATRPLLVVKGKANIVHEPSSPVDAETGVDTDKTNSGGDIEIRQIDEDQGKDVNDQVNLEEKIVELDQGHVGSDPGKTHESRPQPEKEFIKEDQAGPDPKLSAYEHVILEEPLSSSGTLSSMKNMDDAYTFGDQFLNDKSIEDESSKLNMDSEVVSMVTVLIHLASSSVPRLSTPIIDLSPPKPVHASTQAPIFTTTTTTLPLPSPPPQQSTSNSELAACVTVLEQKLVVVFTLELQDLPHKIDQTVNTVVKEAVHIALQAPLRDCFRELPEAYMKEILHQRMFESGLYKSLPKHVALYEVLEASMDRENRDEFLAKKDMSRKRHRDDQDPPPPSPDSDPSKKRRHDSGTSGSSRQQSASHYEQPIEAPMPDTANISDLEDTDSAHLPKIKPVPKWLKPISEEDRPKTLEPDWIGKKKLSKSDLEVPAFKAIDWCLIAAYGISHWWFKRKEFYITRHDAPFDHSQVRAHLQILSVICLNTYGRYGYVFLKENVLRIADYKEYKISKVDFKNLHLNDFEDLYLLHLQGQLNHLSEDDRVHRFNAVNLWIRNIVIRKRVEDLQLGIESYQTKLNLTQPDWDASDFLFKEDYTIVSKPRAVHIKMEMVSTCSEKDEFIIACSYVTNTFKEIMKVQACVSKVPQLWYEHVGPQDTRPQNGKRSQVDDQRLDLADDLKKA
nr:hypothetical protein [Tanacetum cinerariifolium]